ncbi:MAG: hypothetical protein ACFB3T_03210 [Geminicoccaceae bacterium]
MPLSGLGPGRWLALALLCLAACTAAPASEPFPASERLSPLAPADSRIRLDLPAFHAATASRQHAHGALLDGRIEVATFTNADAFAKITLSERPGSLVLNERLFIAGLDALARPIGRISWRDDGYVAGPDGVASYRLGRLEDTPLTCAGTAWQHAADVETATAPSGFIHVLYCQRDASITPAQLGVLINALHILPDSSRRDRTL